MIDCQNNFVWADLIVSRKHCYLGLSRGLKTEEGIKIKVRVKRAAAGIVDE